MSLTTLTISLHRSPLFPLGIGDHVGDANEDRLEASPKALAKSRLLHY